MTGRANTSHIAPELVSLVLRAYKADPEKTEAELHQLDKGISSKNYGRAVDWGILLIDVKSQTD
jgi:hypothetical protein